MRNRDTPGDSWRVPRAYWVFDKHQLLCCCCFFKYHPHPTDREIMVECFAWLLKQLINKIRIQVQVYPILSLFPPLHQMALHLAWGVGGGGRKISLENGVLFSQGWSFTERRVDKNSACLVTDQLSVGSPDTVRSTFHLVLTKILSWESILFLPTLQMRKLRQEFTYVKS